MDTPVPDNGTLPGTNISPPRFDPKKSFKGTSAMDRAKKYLKDVPVLHARLEKVIEEQEANMKSSRASLDNFDAVTNEIRAMVDIWEKDIQEEKKSG